MVTVDDLAVAYRESGVGPPVLLLHGWPTSSYLWRNVIPAIAEQNRVIAVDLPGFGESAKPLPAVGGCTGGGAPGEIGVPARRLRVPAVGGCTGGGAPGEIGVPARRLRVPAVGGCTGGGAPRVYGFEFFDQVLDGLLQTLGIEALSLVAHDLGGPIALHWALHRPERLTRLALLNTLAYPEFSPEVVDFARTLASPGRRATLTSPDGLAALMRLGVADPTSLSDDVLRAVRAPFATAEAQLALAAAGCGLRRSGFVAIARLLPGLRVPVRIVYGAQDRLLPDIADTVSRLRADLPLAEVTELADCGHFVQEDAPERVGDLLARFFAPRP